MLKLFIFILFLYIPGLNSQCYDCAKYWKTRCNATKTGYYCDQGATVDRFENPILYPLWLNCSPRPDILNSIGTYCCVYSPTLGCVLALNPKDYEFMPFRNCKFCQTKCQCEENSSTIEDPWDFKNLGLIGLIGSWKFRTFDSV